MHRFFLGGGGEFFSGLNLVISVSQNMNFGLAVVVSYCSAIEILVYTNIFVCIVRVNFFGYGSNEEKERAFFFVFK